MNLGTVEAFCSGLEGVMALGPMKSLKELAAREENERVAEAAIARLIQCASVLGKRKSSETEMQEFFQSKKIKTQEDMLRAFGEDPDEVAHYFMSGNGVIPVDRAQVFAWLVERAPSLSPETIFQFGQMKDSPRIKVVVEGKIFLLNPLDAASVSPFFRRNQEEFILVGLKAALFELVAKWIERGDLPDINEMNENLFFAFQDLLQLLGITGELKRVIIEETLRRYRLKMTEGSLMLAKGDELNLRPTHSYFRGSITHVVLEDDSSIPILDLPNLSLITLNVTKRFDVELLRDLSCKVELVGETFPKKVASVTTKLVNFVIQEKSDWLALQGENSIERVVVGKGLLDKSTLRQLGGLKSITANSDILYDTQVVQLCCQNPDLESLTLPKAQIGAEGLAALAALKNLRELKVGFTGRVSAKYRVNETPKGKRSFKAFIEKEGFQKLESLALFKGALMKEDFEVLGKLPALKELFITYELVANSDDLINFLQNGGLKKVTIYCHNDTVTPLENGIHRKVTSFTDVCVIPLPKGTSDKRGLSLSRAFSR